MYWRKLFHGPFIVYFSLLLRLSNLPSAIHCGQLAGVPLTRPHARVFAGGPAACGPFVGQHIGPVPVRVPAGVGPSVHPGGPCTHLQHVCVHFPPTSLSTSFASGEFLCVYVHVGSSSVVHVMMLAPVIACGVDWWGSLLWPHTHSHHSRE